MPVTIQEPQTLFDRRMFADRALTQEEIKKFSSLVRRRFNERDLTPAAYARLMSMLTTVCECHHSSVETGLKRDFCIFWALREAQGGSYYHRVRQMFIDDMKSAYVEFRYWMMQKGC